MGEIIEKYMCLAKFIGSYLVWNLLLKLLKD